jgi:hypothetical protein
MGRTMIVCVSIMLFTFLTCYALGVADNFIINFIMSGGSAILNLDSIFGSGGLTVILGFLGAIIVAIAILYGTVGLIIGTFTKQNYDQIMFAPFIAFLVGLNLCMIQVYNAAFQVSKLMALFTIGMFLVLSLFAIIDYYRSPLT